MSVSGRRAGNPLQKQGDMVNILSHSTVTCSAGALAPLLLLLFAFAPAAAQEGWTPELSMEFRTVQGSALSPDGSRVAYVVREPVMRADTSEFRTQIWVGEADGTRNVQYTRGRHSASNPAFSPDGEWIAFTTNRSGSNQVWRIPVAGGEAEQVTHQDEGVGAFAWSPDGTRLAFLMRDPETEEEKARRREKRDVILVDQDFRYSHLYTTGADPEQEGEAEVLRLTSGAFHVTAFDWSPDGRTLVFAHQPDPRINTGFLDSDLATVPSDSGAVTPLVTWDGADTSPRYGPDGRWIAFVSHGGRPEPVGLGDVHLVPASGGEPRMLAETPDRNASLVGWSPDGADVLVLESVRTDRHLLALPGDGSPPRTLTPVEGVVGAPSLSRDGSTLAFTLESPETPWDIHVTPLDRFAPVQVSRLHDGIGLPPLGRTELLTWTSPDGLEIEGLLTYPVDHREGRAVPLILSVHGGPAGVYSRTFTGGPGIYMNQVFAQEGFAVLRPNPRGSTGYGKEFRYANVQDWGFGDLEDLLAGVDLAIEAGVAHPDSLFLMGWSYGGYMTSFAVTRTDRFQAASMGAGLPNLISMVTTTDIPDYLAAHMAGEFWDDYETYQRHSAVYGIGNVTTPTQVIHGAEDLRVPFTQGQEFYVGLQRRGVPTEFVVYPRTPHGPTEPRFLMDVTPRILSWFVAHMGSRRPATN
jgi:dipeptidyl aminopeptidase/acylaminoacyl peptidase